MQGYVTKLGVKTGMGRNGKPYTMYSVQIDGNKWLGHGFNQPACNEGDLIDYTIEQSGQYENIIGISVSSAKPATASATSDITPTAKPVNTTQLSIQYQSSRNAAIETVAMLLANDAVKLPAKQADKYDAALALIEEVTATYFLKLESVIEAGGVETLDALPVSEAA